MNSIKNEANIITRHSSTKAPLQRSSLQDKVRSLQAQLRSVEETNTNRCEKLTASEQKVVRLHTQLELIRRECDETSEALELTRAELSEKIVQHQAQVDELWARYRNMEVSASFVEFFNVSSSEPKHEAR